MDFCVVSWFPFKGILDSASTTIFFLPLIYSISGPYSSIISLHINNLLVLKSLQVRFLWSVYILNFWPSNISLNSFRVSTIVSSYFYVTVYRCWASVILLLYKVIGLPFWVITAPNWNTLVLIKYSKDNILRLCDMFSADIGNV